MAAGRRASINPNSKMIKLGGGLNPMLTGQYDGDGNLIDVEKESDDEINELLDGMDINDQFMSRLDKLLGNMEKVEKDRKALETPNFKEALSINDTPRFNDKEKDSQFHFEDKDKKDGKKKSVKFASDKKNP